MPSKVVSTCGKCRRQFKHQTYFNRHIQNCNPELNLEPKRYTCKVCEKEFNTPGALGGHMGIAHSEKSMNKKKEFDCPVCKVKFVGNDGSFAVHVKSHDEEFDKAKREAISKAKTEFYADAERSRYARENSRQLMLENNPMFNRENVEKMTEARREYIDNLSDEEYSAMIQNFINAPKKGNAVSHSGKFTPTKIEQMIIDLNIPGLIYNGNKEGAKTIRFENNNYKHSLTPDFIYEYDERKVIETFGVYWHPKEDEELYVKACEENDYNILILWEDEIYKNIEQIQQKIIEFLND